MCCRQGSSKPPALSLEFTVIRIMSLPRRGLRHGRREPRRRRRASWPFGLPSSRAPLLTNPTHWLALIRWRVLDGDDRAMSS
jgi:hypothetical protein